MNNFARGTVVLNCIFQYVLSAKRKKHTIIHIIYQKTPTYHLSMKILSPKIMIFDQNTAITKFSLQASILHTFG